MSATPLVEQRRIYVLDTSVLLSSPNALRAFKEHEVVLPLVVLKELEAKRFDPDLGWAARTTLRILERLRVEGGDLTRGVVVTGEGGIVRVELNHVDQSKLPEAVRRDSGNDTRILAVAYALLNEGNNVTLVSKDLPLRLLASVSCGLRAEEYVNEQDQTHDDYQGIMVVEVGSETVNDLYENRLVEVADLFDPTMVDGVAHHTGLVLKSSTNSVLGVLNNDCKRVELVDSSLEAFGVCGRSAEQRIGLHHLLNPEIGIVSLGGPAGTGKSLLALAAGLELVLERGMMERVTVFRPVMSVGGQDLGYLPGSEADKMDPWGAAVWDALRAFTTDAVITEVRERNLVEILPLTHIRGRTLVDSFVIVDECQNLERGTILTALTRIGAGSRIVLLHDVAQRDNLRVGRHDGIAAVVGRLVGEPLFAHTTLSKSERSPVAALASKLLDF